MRWMIFTLLACGALGIPVVMLSETSREPAAPRIVFAEQVLDFGTMGQFDHKTAELAFLNEGPAELRILALEPDCDCTPVLVSQEAYARDEAGTILVTLSTNAEKGTKKGTFAVHTNDPEHPVTTIELRAEVVPEYSFEPELLNLGTVGRGKTAEGLVHITPVAAAGLQLISASCDCEHVAVSCERSRFEESCPVELRVKLLSSMPEGRFKAQVIIETDNARLPHWTIPVIGVVRGEVLVEPTIVTLGTIAGGESRGGIVRVHGLSSASLELVELRCPLEFLSFRALPAPATDDCEVAVSVAPDAPSGLIDTNLTITVRGTDPQCYTVRVFGLIP
ncbi:MAG: DUF1573 domain-containing protein [Planctomycetota bacterium]